MYLRLGKLPPFLRFRAHELIACSILDAMKRTRKTSAPALGGTDRAEWARRLLSAALMVFVGVCIVTLVVKHLRTGPATADSPLPDDGLVVCYLHSNTRCTDCLNLERGAQAAVEAGVAQGQLEKNVVFRSVNYELPENQSLVNRYDLIAPTVVLIRRVDGKDADWKGLPEAWDLRGDPQQLREFLLNAVRSFQESSR